MNGEQWLRLIRVFGGTKYLRVTGKLATDVLRALFSLAADEGRESVPPALRHLRVEVSAGMLPDSFQNSLESFLARRRLSGHPVGYSGLVTADEGILRDSFQDTLESSLARRRLSDHPVDFSGLPTAEEVTSAKRWVEEQKRAAFNHGSSSYFQVPFQIRFHFYNLSDSL
jgi:hypothetical protein